MEFLKETVFSKKFDAHEKTEPFLFFFIPGIGDFGLTGFDPWFWGQLLTLVISQSLVNLLCAIIVYKIIFLNQGTSKALLTGYGLICPLLLVLPFQIITILELRNPTLMMASAAGPSLLCWRTFEAMYGTVPDYASKDLGSYILYFCSTVQFDFNAETKEVRRVTWRSLFQRKLGFAWLFLQMTIMNSVLLSRNFQIFPMDRNTWTSLFSWRSLANNYIMAFHTSVSLEIGAAGIALGISMLSGIETMDLNISPLTTSTSPSDFWGNRWTRVVSSALKRGVFVPLRKQGISRPVAALATFVASGLLHEYLLLVITYKQPAADLNVAGSHLAFFIWNGVVLGIDHMLRGNKIVDALSKALPGRIRSFLVVLTVLPLAHLFTQVYVDVGFYTAFSRGFPRIVKL